MAEVPTATPTTTMTADTTTADINTALDSVQAAQTTLDPRAEVLAAQQTRI